ncbi:MAG TPA: hypothetical protein VGB12_07790 [bacterium]
MRPTRTFPAPWPFLLAATTLVLAGCGGGGGGGGSETAGAAQVLEVVQPAPASPEATPPQTDVATPSTPVQVTAAAIHYRGERTAGRATVGRREQPLTLHAIAAPVESQGLPLVDFVEGVADTVGDAVQDFLDLVLPDKLVDDILGIEDDDDHDDDIHDYFPTGAQDQWTFLGDAEILQGADPVLLFGLAGTGPTTYGFTLAVQGSGFYFVDQEVSGGTVTAEPALLWIPNDLRVGSVHTGAADLTHTPTAGTATTVHVARRIELVAREAHATLHSYFADALHFRIVDTVTRGDGTTAPLTYDLYLGRGFGPVECNATDGGIIRHAEIERAAIRGRPRPDTDGDGLIDADDPDDDNDGVPDDHQGSNTPGAWEERCRTATAGCDDAFPKDPAEQADNDGDRVGNRADPDDDNDAVPDGVDYYPWDGARSEAPYRVYLWATDPGGVRHLYTLDPDAAGAQAPAEILPDQAPSLWGLAVCPRRPDGPTAVRLAFLAPAAGAGPADATGSHLWVADEDGVRDITPDLHRRVLDATWEVGGESLYFGLWDSTDDPNLVLRQVDRLGLDPPDAPVGGRVWKYRFGATQRYLAYADDSHLFSDLILRDRQGGRRELTPEENDSTLFGILRKSFSVFELDRDPEFSADGSRLAAGGALSMIERWVLFFTIYDRGPEEAIRVWETATGRVVRKLDHDTFGVGTLEVRLPQGFAALSPFGRYLAVEVYPEGGGRLDVVDLASGAITTVSDILPAPETYPAHWELGSGGWTFTDPPALVLALADGGGVSRPVRLPVDGSGPAALSDLPSEGPILLSPHGRHLFFVHDQRVWRVDTATRGTPVAITDATFADHLLRLEVAR